MKILSGVYRGRNLFMPAHIRPTQNILRKAVFDIIGHDLAGVVFLDLFAGSGAMGLEALSCGAAEAWLVERDPRCLEVISTNTERLSPGTRGQRAVLRSMDAFAAVKALAREGRRFDVVFFDPPFGLRLGRKMLKTLMTHDILSPNSYVVAQYGTEETLPDPGITAGIPGRFSVIRDKTYGTSRLTVIERLP